MRNSVVLVIAGVGLLLQACGDEVASQPGHAADSAKVYPRQQDPLQLARGSVLYQQHCAACHGAQAEGAPGWYRPDAQGQNPPPPLNGTGHAWHHPLPVLRRTIAEGTAILGGNMPAWKGTLSTQEIDDVIAWFQAKWPEPLFQAWARNNARTGAANRQGES